MWKSILLSVVALAIVTPGVLAMLATGSVPCALPDPSSCSFKTRPGGVVPLVIGLVIGGVLLVCVWLKPRPW